MTTAAVRTGETTYLRWPELARALRQQQMEGAQQQPEDENGSLEMPSTEARAAFASFMDHGARDALLTVLVDHAVLNFHITQYASERFLPADDVRSVNCREWLAALDERCAAMHARLTVRSLSELSLLAVLAPRLPLLREISLILPEVDFIRLPCRKRNAGDGQTATAKLSKALAVKQAVVDAATVAGATRSLADRVVSLTYQGLPQDAEMWRSAPNRPREHARFNAVIADLPNTFPSLSSLKCVSGPFTCESLAAVAAHPQLRRLEIPGSARRRSLTPEGFMEVGAARCLEFLDVSGTTLCHASSGAIASIASLTHLSMAGCTGCATMEGFSRLPNLTSLDVSHTALSAGALASLGDCPLRELRLARLAMTVDPSVLSALTSLEVLDLSDSRVVGSGHVEALLGLAHLRHLDVSMCPMIGGELANLAQVKSLQVLDVRMSTTDAETVAALRETIPVVRARLTYPGGVRYW